MKVMPTTEYIVLHVYIHSLEKIWPKTLEKSFCFGAFLQQKEKCFTEILTVSLVTVVLGVYKNIAIFSILHGFDCAYKLIIYLRVCMFQKVKFRTVWNCLKGPCQEIFYYFYLQDRTGPPLHLINRLKWFCNLIWYSRRYSRNKGLGTVRHSADSNFLLLQNTSIES